jgi:hypothetical protein
MIYITDALRSVNVSNLLFETIMTKIIHVMMIFWDMVACGLVGGYQDPRLHGVHSNFVVCLTTLSVNQPVWRRMFEW